MANFVTYDLAPSYLSTWIKVHHLPLVSGIEKKVLYSEVFILACVSEDTRADFFLFFSSPFLLSPRGCWIKAEDLSQSCSSVTPHFSGPGDSNASLKFTGHLHCTRSLVKSFAWMGLSCSYGSLMREVFPFLSFFFSFSKSQFYRLKTLDVQIN